MNSPVYRPLLWGTRAAANLLLPPECVSCSAEIASDQPPPLLCADCLGDLQLLDGPTCPKCGAPAPSGVVDLKECALCRGVRFQFSGVSALGVYQRSLIEIVLTMKKRSFEPLTIAIGQILASRVQQQWGREVFDIVAPVPMHWMRRLSRGVNCPDVLCEPLAKVLGAPMRLQQLSFGRNSRRQSTLGPRARRANVRGALQVAKNHPVSGAQVLLVDDILTTGSTANEAAKVLRRAGARKVRVAVVARAIGV